MAHQIHFRATNGGAACATTGRVTTSSQVYDVTCRRCATHAGYQLAVANYKTAIGQDDAHLDDVGADQWDNEW